MKLRALHALLLLLAATASSSIAAQALCPRLEVAASVAGQNWGVLTTTVENGGDSIRARTNDAGAGGIATSISDASVSACDMNVEVSVPSVPGRSPGSFGWGEGRAFASFTAPRSGTLVARARLRDLLLSGNHDGVTGLQVELKIDGIAVPASVLAEATVENTEVLQMPVGPGAHTLELRVRNVSATPFAFFPAGGDLIASGSVRIFLDPLRTGIVRDVDRFGSPSGALAGATVRLLAGDSELASTVTAADGGFVFNGFDPALGYALQIEHGSLVRRYADLTLAAMGTTSLALPHTLRPRVDAELARLEATPTLVRAYDTTTLRALLQEWNSTTPAAASEQAQRDLALGRLLVATEALGALFTDTAPVATDAAKLTVDTIVSFLSIRKVLDEIAGDAARRAGTLAGEAVAPEVRRRLVLALEFIVTALELGSDKLQAALVDTLKSLLPAWAADLFEASLKVIVSTTLEAFSSGQWSAGDGRAGFLEAVTTELASQVGSRVLASAYVEQTSADARVAAIRARRFDGSGAVVDAFAQVQTRVGEVAIAHQELVALNATLGDTAKGWGTVADLSLLVGRRPGAQLAAAIGTVLKGISAGALAGLSLANFTALHDTAFDEAPAAVSASFVPPATPRAHRFARGVISGKSLPAGYSQALDALRSALSSDDEEALVAAGEALLVAHRDLDAAIALQRLRLLARADDATPSPRRTRLAELGAAEGLLAGERLILHAHLAGVLEPGLADPALGLDAVLQQVDAVAAALAQLDAALAVAAAEAADVLAPPTIFVLAHGIDHPTARAAIGPGAFTLRAEIINAGDATADDVSVELALEIDAPELVGAPRLELKQPGRQMLGTLAAGERRTLRWQAQYTAEPRPAAWVAAYRFAPALSSGRADAAGGGFALLPELERIFGDAFD